MKKEINTNKIAVNKRVFVFVSFLLLIFIGRICYLCLVDYAVNDITISAFIVNQDYTKDLMAYHNIYKSYAWLGGHLDGDFDTLRVAIKEAEEESSITNLKLITKDIISLDVIEVCGHFKRGEWITPHVHLNVTYLFEANDTNFIQNKEDENSIVAWLPIEKLNELVSEDNMKVIYQKIIDKLKLLTK